MTRRIALVVAATLAAGCNRGPQPPVPVDTRNDTCSWCRMAVSNARCAAEIVAPAEEPRIFDDVGCLRSYLKGGARIPAGAVSYVADHRTGTWIPAARATYSRLPGVATPMASGIVAHADAASRDADADAGTGRPLTVADVFGESTPPEGHP